MAVVFMGIVGMFLACHALKIFLSLHEMLVIRDAMQCHKEHKRGFPVWAEITATFRKVYKEISHKEMASHRILQTLYLMRSAF